MPVTSGRFWDYKPAISPDGKWLAFSRSEEGPSEIRVQPTAGGAARAIARTFADDRWPSWSRDSRRLMFHRLVDRGKALRILHRRTDKVLTVAGAAESPGQGSLSPDGRSVVYAAIQDGRQVLRIRDIAGGEARTLDGIQGAADFPRWSPDGRHIAFAFKPGEYWELATIQPDGEGLEIWTAALRPARSINALLDWSPDSRRIAFHASTQPFEANIYVLDTATRRIENVTSDDWYSEAPAWTPDGKALAFMSTRGGGWTWGFFQLTLADGKVSPIAAKADYTEKDFIRFAGDGRATWSAYGDDGIEYVVEREPGGAVTRRTAAGPWARWPSYSSDGGAILFTAVDHRVEYWIAENVTAPDSPILRKGSEAPVLTSVECDRQPAETQQAETVMSPLKMHHR